MRCHAADRECDCDAEHDDRQQHCLRENATTIELRSLCESYATLLASVANTLRPPQADRCSISDNTLMKVAKFLREVEAKLAYLSGTDDRF